MRFKKMFIILMSFICLFLTPISVNATDNSTFTGDINDLDIDISPDGVSYGGDLDAAKTKNSDNAWNHFFSKYKGFIVGISGIGTLTMIILFVMNFMKLGATSGNPQERQKVLTGLIITGLATAGLGSVTTFVTLFYYILR